MAVAKTRVSIKQSPNGFFGIRKWFNLPKKNNGYMVSAKFPSTSRNDSCITSHEDCWCFSLLGRTKKNYYAETCALLSLDYEDDSVFDVNSLKSSNLSKFLAFALSASSKLKSNIGQMLKTLSNHSEKLPPDDMEEDLQCLISRLTRSNVSLLHENEHLQFEAQRLKLALQDHIDHLNSIYYTLWKSGYSALEFPDGEYVSLSQFRGVLLNFIQNPKCQNNHSSCSQSFDQPNSLSVSNQKQPEAHWNKSSASSIANTNTNDLKKVLLKRITKLDLSMRADSDEINEFVNWLDEDDKVGLDVGRNATSSRTISDAMNTNPNSFSSSGNTKNDGHQSVKSIRLQRSEFKLERNVSDDVPKLRSEVKNMAQQLSLPYQATSSGNSTPSPRTLSERELRYSDEVQGEHSTTTDRNESSITAGAKAIKGARRTQSSTPSRNAVVQFLSSPGNRRQQGNFDERNTLKKTLGVGIGAMRSSTNKLKSQNNQRRNLI